jgi:hypothetical protein
VIQLGEDAEVFDVGGVALDLDVDGGGDRDDAMVLLQIEFGFGLVHFGIKQPGISEIGTNRVPSLGLVGINGDEAAVQIDFLPIEPL